MASQLPRAFTTQVGTITDDAQGSVTLKMTTPVTFILGPPTNLHAKFVAIARRMAQGMPDARVLVVPGGHALALENPQALVDALAGASRA